MARAIPARAVPRRSPARRLGDYRGLHSGETMVVCGCGRSLLELAEPERLLTVGVNDVGRLFDPTYLVVLNPRSQFRGDRFRHVEESRARAVFTQLDLGLRHPCVVRFRLGRRSGTDIDDPGALPYTRNSPYVAVCLAAFMGARRIGLIGVDFTDHHFFAATGRHPLARELAQIDREYAGLARALEARGVELVNLSRESRLASLAKVEPAAFARPALALAPPPPETAARPRVFFVHYRFLSCGEVFRRGLEGAARDLGICWASASWDDGELPGKVERFAPDLLFVVHGRRFRQRWGERFRRFRSAVWLLDEPYEVDDTERTSPLFDTVFVNDPSTLGRHGDAHYLPVAWDPHAHTPGASGEREEEARTYDVGFIGGGNPTREAMLGRLAAEGLLSYVVGGPWRSRELASLCLAGNVPAERTAELYRRTRIAINVFRDRHHFNRRRLPATSLNPRVYEALACGALVISEDRPELARVFPELPRFTDAEGLVAQVRGLLADPERFARLLAASRARLAPHTYAERLRAVLAAALPERGAEPSGEAAPEPRPAPEEGPRDVTVVVAVRAADEARRRNARAILAALARQDLERRRYRVVVVEQDAEPRLAPDPELAPLADRWLFAYNPGPYNRAWGLNVGAVAALGTRDPGAARGALCLLDADLLAPPDFLARGLAAMEEGVRALLPYREILYLDAPSTERVLATEPAAGAPADLVAPAVLTGRRFTDSLGGALWVDAALYLAVGGHDERFRGWGSEDREMARRLERAAGRLRRLDGCLLHLDHPRPPESDEAATANQRLWAELRRRPVRRGPAPESRGFGDLRRYREEPPGGPSLPAPPPAGRREWEHWHRWAPERIAALMAEERATGPAASPRRELAELAARLGSSLLDLGCGPGALWPRLEPHRATLDWTGADVTLAMLRVARRLAPGAPVVQADSGALPWGTDAFDVVLLRHVLDHQPPWLMAATLAEALRVARRAVLVAFWVPPADAGERQTRRVGEGFLETRWPAAELETPITAAGWRLAERRRPARPGRPGAEEVWILAPAGLEGELFLRPEPAAAPSSAPAEPFKISIVMPTYRRPHRLATAVAGVLAQTYGNWELIVVDNGGGADPGTADPRVRLVRHAERASASWARNQGLTYATGDLVCFFDDDDDMAPDYLARFAAAFREHPGARMVRCGMSVGGGRVDYSFATPEVCLRREHATATWRRGGTQDQVYFREIARRNRWREGREIVLLRVPLCRANHDPKGGLREGAT